MRLVGPGARIKVPRVKLRANLHAVTLVVGDPPDSEPFVDPGWHFAHTHVWRIKVDRVAAHWND